MRLHRTLCALVIAGLVAPSVLQAADTAVEERAALASFQALLDGLGQRDKALMLAHSLPGGAATLMRDGKPRQMSLEELADKVTVPGKDAHEERILDPLVRVDGDVAIIWARFEFLVNGKMDHCGRDIASLVKVDGQWRVAAIQDNASAECGAGSRKKQ